MSLSSGGGFSTLSISSLGLQYSWALGLYVPRVARLLRAINRNVVKRAAIISRRIIIIGTTIIAISAVLVSFVVIYENANNIKNKSNIIIK